MEKNKFNKFFEYFYVLLLGLFFTIYVFDYDIKDNVPDKYDHLHIAWQTNNVANKIISGDFKNIANLSHFYPRENTLFYSDSLIEQSILVTFFRFFSKNYILAYNLSFILNFLLLLFSIYLFISYFTNKAILRISFSYALFFSHFFTSRLGHHQFMSVWPLFLFLILFFKIFDKKNKNNIYQTKFTNFKILKTSFILAVLCGSLFYSNLIVTFFLAVILIPFFLLCLPEGTNNNTVFYNNLFRLGFFFSIITMVLIMPYIKGYLIFKSSHKSLWDYDSFLVYSAHLSDYLFQPRHSGLNRISLFNNWRLFDKHVIGERAFSIGLAHIMLYLLCFISFILGLVKRGKVLIKYNKYVVWGLIVIIMGFIFSLGPRLFFNGNYLIIPLPYSVLIDLPILSSIRAPARWYLVVVIVVNLISLIILEDFLSRKKSTVLKFLFLILFFSIIFLEFTPKKMKGYKIDFNRTVIYNNIDCRNGSLLEYPIFKNNATDYIDNHSYKKQILFGQLYHNCPLYNGDASFDPPDYLEEAELLQENLFSNESIDILNSYNINVIKINFYALNEDQAIYIENNIDKLIHYKVVFQNSESIIMQRLD